jgi:hypothetical protein
MNRNLSLSKFLKILCVLGEVGACIGLLAMAISIPFSESMVDARRADVGLFVRNGSPEWSMYARLPNTANAYFSYGRLALPSVPHQFPEPDQRLGDISFGPFRMDADEGVFPVSTRDIKAQAVVIDHVEGTVTFRQPKDASEVLASTKWPFVATMLCTGLAGLAILELLRRMFKSVEKGDVFCAANIRNVRSIGLLLVASSILKFIAAGWLVSRMASLVREHVAGKVALAPTYEGNLSGLATGIMILALAEVFRQGLMLKEENQLTI